MITIVGVYFNPSLRPEAFRKEMRVIMDYRDRANVIVCGDVNAKGTYVRSTSLGVSPFGRQLDDLLDSLPEQLSLLPIDAIEELEGLIFPATFHSSDDYFSQLDGFLYRPQGQDADKSHF